MPAILEPTWTADRVTALKQLAIDGFKAIDIARALGGGISRSSVIAKIHREKLLWNFIYADRGEKPATTRAKRKNPFDYARANGPPIARRWPSASMEPGAVNLVPGSRSCSLLDLTDATCRWPIGDPATPNFFFCGEMPDCGPYCGSHARIAYARRSG